MKIPETENIYSVGKSRFGPDPGSSYLIDSERKVLVETGTSKSINGIIEDLEKLGVRKLDYIAVTHIHLDHAGGAGFLLDKFPEAKLLVHKKGAKHLVDPSKLIKSVKRAVGDIFNLYGETKPISEEKIVPISGDEKFDLGHGYILDPIDTPGHAPHHLCYHEKKNSVIFTGDAAGLYYPEKNILIPSTPPPNFDLEKAKDSLEKLKDFQAKLLIYTHVGWKDKAKENLTRYEKILEEWVKEIEEIKTEEETEDKIIKKMVKKYAPEWARNEEEIPLMRENVKMDVKGVLLYLKRKHK